MPGAAWFMTVGVFVNRFGSFVILFLALYLTRQLHFSPTQAGTAVAAYGVGEVLAGGAGGDLADRIGRRNTITLSMLGSAAALIALSQASSFRAIVALAFVVGLMSEMYRPASAALAIDLVPEGGRVTVFAVLRLASNLGFAAGSALAGFFADHSFLWLFLADAASSALFAIIAVLALPADSGQRAEEGESPKPGYRALLSDRAFLLLLVSAAFITFVYYQELVGVPLHVRAVRVVERRLRAAADVQRRPRGAAGAPPVVHHHATPAEADTGARVPAGGRRVQPDRRGEHHADAPGDGRGLVGRRDDRRPRELRVRGRHRAEAHAGRYQGIFGLAWGSGAVTGPALGAFLLGRNSMLFWPLLAVLGVAAAGLVLVGRAAGAAIMQAEETAVRPGSPDPPPSPRRRRFPPARARPSSRSPAAATWSAIRACPGSGSGGRPGPGGAAGEAEPPRRAHSGRQEVDAGARRIYRLDIFD